MEIHVGIFDGRKIAEVTRFQFITEYQMSTLPFTMNKCSPNFDIPPLDILGKKSNGPILINYQTLWSNLSIVADSVDPYLTDLTGDT